MADWLADGVAALEPEVTPRSGVMVYVDEADPDCGLGFVRYVLAQDRPAVIALLRAQLAAIESAEVSGREGDDVLHQRVIEEARSGL